MSDSRLEPAADGAATDKDVEIGPSLLYLRAPSIVPDAPEHDLKQWTAPAVVPVAAILGVTSVVAAVLATMAFSQLRSVKADVSASREELMLAQERTTKLERQLEKALQDLDQRIQQAAATEQRQSGPAKQGAASFQLTAEEMQLVRSFIKASPVSTDVTGSIGVGEELRDTRMLPLPSQIAAKSTRLAGGRFKIDRNGAIVISLRKSQQVDAVIQPN